MRIALVEDEAAFLETAIAYLQRFSKEEQIPIDLECFSSGFEFVDKYTPRFDLIFMDIRMPNSNGMAAARDIRKLDAEVGIIFLTSLTQYAVKGYEVEALDYLVKPVEYELFRSRVRRAIQRLSKRGKHYVTIRVKSELKKIDVDELVYVESEGHRVIYHLQNENIAVWESMTAAETKLAPHHFLRCNSYYLVNLRYVTGVSEDTVSVGANSLKMSRAKRRSFMDGLTAYLSGGEST